MVRQLPCINPNTICYLADLLSWKLCQQRAYNASVLPILYPLESTGIYDNYNSARGIETCQQRAYSCQYALIL
jgi:hypothetical protein